MEEGSFTFPSLPPICGPVQWFSDMLLLSDHTFWNSAVFLFVWDNNKKWAVFTYHSPKIRKITNLFRQTNIHIAYKSSNTIQQRTRPRIKNTTQDKDKSGIYNLTCKPCKKSYIGQTSRTLTIRHHEHTRYIKNNDPQSAYALHIPQNVHEYGPINDTMSLLKPVKKTHMLVPYEQLYIQSFHQNGRLIPEQNCGEQNPLFALVDD
jgi:hypothetical protein